MLLDITELLKPPRRDCYVFNPSMVHVKGNFYLVCYRICRYNYTQEFNFHNPWKTWDNGYKFFSRPLDVIALKYRTAGALDPARVIPFTREYDWLPSPTDEYDSTSIALIEITPSGTSLVFNMERPFPMMNQDARLGFVGDTLMMSYNAFYRDKLALLNRTVTIDWAELEIHLGPEQFMFNQLSRVEKNCTFSPRGHVLYSIGRVFTVIVGDCLYLRRRCPLESIIDYYGDDQILCSLSTPPVPYRDRYLACGHIKIVYKKITKEPLLSFIRRFQFLPEGNIYPHGKFIYVAFFFEFDRDYNVTRISNMFLPTSFSSHLPYALVMPTGLTYSSPEEDGARDLFLTYGEGDRKCILLRLSLAQVEELLAARKHPMGAYFLTETPRIRHVGYFGAKNSGDDAFKYVFQWLHEKYYPYATIEFAAPDQHANTETHLTILGGGDVINSFFAGSGADIAVSVGVPYDEFYARAADFKLIFTRNQVDVPRLRAASGAPQVEYYPDLCFLFPRIFPALSRPPDRIVMGVSVLRTYYHPEYVPLYEEYLAAMASWINLILEIEWDLTICLLPFGINTNNSAENDIITCQEILDRVTHKQRVQIFLFTEVPTLYRKIQELSFVVCARFHSHVFSAAAQIPFVSVTCGRKCKQFMEQYGRGNYMFTLDVNEIDLPININVSALSHFIYTHYKQRHNQSKISFSMEEFEQAYLRALRQYTRASPLQLF